jgi:hypothetical protein
MLRRTISVREANFKDFLCGAALTYMYDDIHK